MQRLLSLALIVMLVCVGRSIGHAQVTNASDDIWREVQLSELDYQKEKNYCLRLYGYFRYIDEGTVYAMKRQDKLYEVYEGICELDVRYDRKEDEGAVLMVGRNLVHPERPANVMAFYELTPYTFLEKARRAPKRFTIKAAGDTTRIFTRQGLAGTALRDTLRRELQVSYNAIAPDTLKSINLLVLRAQLSNVWADAAYALDDDMQRYVPQGNLKHITFEGDVDMQIYPGMGTISTDNDTKDLTHMVYHEHSEFYIDSVAYMTRTEYRADRNTTAAERRQRSGYTNADIDRLRQKLNVPPLPAAIEQRIEDQRDWEDMTEHWKKTNKAVNALEKTVGKAMEKGEEMLQKDEHLRKAADAARRNIGSAMEKQLQDNE